jgi:hypothetical protein
MQAGMHNMGMVGVDRMIDEDTSLTLELEE